MSFISSPPKASMRCSCRRHEADIVNDIIFVEYQEKSREKDRVGNDSDEEE
jgi:hypothetical protein